MSEYKFLYWDDPGDSQSHVDKQCSCNEWQQQIQHKELGSCCKDTQQQGFYFDDYEDYTEEE